MKVCYQLKMGKEFSKSCVPTFFRKSSSLCGPELYYYLNHPGSSGPEDFLPRRTGESDDEYYSRAGHHMSLELDKKCGFLVEWQRKHDAYWKACKLSLKTIVMGGNKYKAKNLI